MASHSDIVKRAVTAEEVALANGVSVHTVRSWIQRNSIPAEMWAWFAREDHATLAELADAAAARKAAA